MTLLEAPREAKLAAESRNMYQIVAAQAARNSEAVAILAPGRAPLSYGRLLDHITRTVRQLNAMGVGHGDRVAVVLPNGPEMATTILAVICGAACAPLNPSCSADEFRRNLSLLQASHLLVLADVDSPAREAALELGLPTLEVVPDYTAACGVFSLQGSARGPAKNDGFTGDDDAAFVMLTTGTTSLPRVIVKTQAYVRNHASIVCERGDVGPEDVCLNMLPLFRGNGIGGPLVRPLAAGARVVCPPAFDAERFFAWLDMFRPTWFTAVPAMLQAILAEAAAHREVLARCPLRFITSGSSSLPRTLAEELERAFNVPVIDTYGLTESGLCTMSSLAPGGHRVGSVGQPVKTVQMAILDEAGQVLPPGVTGEIVVRGPSVATRYENDPEASKAAFIDGWFHTGDLGYFDADGFLFLVGRRKEMINRGGEKVAPGEVEEALLQHPGVEQAVAFAMPHPTLGEEVAAAVVLRAGSVVTELDLRSLAATKVAPFKVPQRIVCLPEIPRGPTGKPQRIGLAARLGLTGETTDTGTEGEYARPDGALETALAAIWAEVLQVERVGRADDFFALGGDSLRAARASARVRRRWGVELPLRSFFSHPTLAELAAEIGRRGAMSGERV